MEVRFMPPLIQPAPDGLRVPLSFIYSYNTHICKHQPINDEELFVSKGFTK